MALARRLASNALERNPRVVDEVYAPLGDAGAVSPSRDGLHPAAQRAVRLMSVARSLRDNPTDDRAARDFVFSDHLMADALANNWAAN